MANKVKSSKSYFQLNKTEGSFNYRAPLIAITIFSRDLISLKEEIAYLSGKNFDLIEIRGDYFIESFGKNLKDKDLAASDKSLKEKDKKFKEEYFFENDLDHYVALKTREFIYMIKETFKDKKIIFTLRSAKEGGFFNGDHRSYFRINRLAFLEDIDFIDIEYLRLKALKEKRIKAKPLDSSEDFERFSSIISEKNKDKPELIVSYHDLYKLLNKKEIIYLYKDMETYSPDLIKIVYKSEKNDDIYPIFYASKLFKEKKTPYSLLNMGKLGYVSRYLAPAFGSSLVFAKGFKASAKGQVEIGKLNKFYKSFLDKT